VKPARRHWNAEPGWAYVALRWLTVALLVPYALIGTISAYRAWVQVHSLSVHAGAPVLSAGTRVTVDAVSWARTFVSVRLVLAQDERADTLLARVIPANRVASIDPRWRRASADVVLTPELLARYREGPARLRATATGGPQWFRTPAPLVRDLVLPVRR
jgi:hypothetical protein